jgi:predicted peroxiredoxin
MFYFTTFILALVTWTQQQNGSFSLSPYTTYTPPSQHHIPKEKVTHGVNIYLCEQFQDQSVSESEKENVNEDSAVFPCVVVKPDKIKLT